MEYLVLVKFKTLPYNRRYIKLVLWENEGKANCVSKARSFGAPGAVGRELR